jgi:DNA adenine methylase
MNEHASAWLTAVEGLPAVHARLKRVAILPPSDALAVVRSLDGDDTLFYLDPPYYPDCLSTNGVYARTPDAAHHHDLLALLGGLAGKFALSGYRCPVYDEAAARFGWTRTEFDSPNHAAGGAVKRRMVECVWTNYDPKGVSR